MVARLCVGVAVLLVACGGSDGASPSEPASAGAGGAAAQAGSASTPEAGAAQHAGNSSAGGPTAGAGAGAGAGGDAVAGSAGATQATAGQPSAGMGGGGAPMAGTSSGGKAGQGGTAAAGSGGQTVDPIEPKPVPGCAGYVSVFVPHNTCVWFHGTFTTQVAGSCVESPPEQKCATASAPSKDITAIVSSGAEIERFDFGATGCPKQCN